ncbi:uroporphyrinogen-III C-methyltransferase [Aliidiomarina celeris]|uniref:uroporphyrinogen-III C-methyltransferase n=1 Tax=Aliidiomarina celeris TaxID=2249428 RepID=UPI000DE91A25|nr:uroporphyrinogen-III C-methyltransferase [Aliidiomarina celeris]
MAKGVLLIRAEQKSDPLELLLRERGFSVYTHSMVDIRALTVEPNVAAQWCTQPWHGIVVVSPNAVRFFERVRSNPPWPKPNLGYFTVGPGTAEPLRRASQAPVTWPTQAHNSETLLKLAELQHVEGQHWLIITGENGRSLLRNTLSDRGAKVTVAEVYTRVPTETNLNQSLPNWLTSVNKIVVTSKEQAELFCQQLRAQEEASTWARTCHWCVPSERVAEVLTEFNVPAERIHLAHSAMPADIRTALTRIKEDKAMTEAKNAPEQPKAKKESRFWSRFLLFILLLCVLTLAAGGWFLWQQNQQFQSHAEQEFDALRNRLTEAQRRDAAFEERLANRMQAQMQRELEASNERQQNATQNLAEQQERQQQLMRERLSQYERDIARLSQRVSRVETNNSEAWLLQEAYDRVNVAIQRLNVDGDPRVALILLTTARTILADDGSQQSIVDQLERDIRMIEEVPTVDYSGVTVLLNELQRGVPNLPLAQPERTTSDSTTTDEATSARENVDWRSNLADAWQAFSKDMIRIQRNTDIPLQLNAEQRLVVNSRLELQLQLAQQALMRRQQEIFSTSLFEIEYLITHYFNTEANETRQFMASLNALKELDIAPEFPTQLLSRAMLRERLRDLESEPAAVEEPRP